MPRLANLNSASSPAVVVLTFDHYATAHTVAYPILKARGLIATYFVDPRAIGIEVTKDQLKELRDAGWSIQGYTGVNMVALLKDQGVDAARQRLLEIKRAMAANGFPITALAPAQRAWTADLRDLANGIYTSVRVADHFVWQPRAVDDPLWVKFGGTPSLGQTDSATSLGQQLGQLIKQGGVWFVVAHKVGDNADSAYSVRADVLASFADLLAKERKASRIKVMTFDQFAIGDASTPFAADFR